MVIEFRSRPSIGRSFHDDRDSMKIVNIIATYRGERDKISEIINLLINGKINKSTRYTMGFYKFQMNK